MARDLQRTTDPSDTSPVHTASLRIRVGNASVDGAVSISTRGLLAVGGLVSGILLSSAVIVLVATRKVPRHRWLPWDR
ncbi:hypothetical protein CNR27_03690 [Luteimonas chenhongjianii]|uniref:Uncharacterized protein n=1 Tax=Luteimonas chenhongjianii TaxID=2006110 RepID=A0A290XBY4_9GAMM|nr:hypothetical protein [Luteimonas chenhongjianii]ATD66662.1 hypothetical protein CNR27_03690 [Luteimonas chenhongjianii]